MQTWILWKVSLVWFSLMYSSIVQSGRSCWIGSNDLDKSDCISKCPLNSFCYPRHDETDGCMCKHGYVLDNGTCNLICKDCNYKMIRKSSPMTFSMTTTTTTTTTTSTTTTTTTVTTVMVNKTTPVTAVVEKSRFNNISFSLFIFVIVFL